VDNNRILTEIDRRARRRRLMQTYGRLYDHTKPFGDDNPIGVYNWQAEFHNAGATNKERCIIAANRVGKTMSSGAEAAIHATGLYPPWWKGRRFEKATKGWVGSVTNESSKDIIQPALLGTEVADPGHPDFGTGWIPGDKIIGKPSTRQAGVSDVVDTIQVKHVSGGQSSITLKTYEQGRAKWQGTARDWVWLDEEPPMDIYTEALTRTLDTKGVVWLSFTPLLGPSEAVQHFLNAKPGQGIYVKNASWEDAPHLDRAEREKLWQSYPAHERKTRSEGTPLLGSGAIFPVDDDTLMTDPVEIKKWWRRINGIDFGIDHPAAGAFCALDPEGPGTFYVYDCYRAAGETPIYHSAAMRKHGDWIPTAWPHDGLQRDKGSGVALKDLYRKQGLYMLRDHAAYEDERGNHVEPGLIEMLEWMRTGRFKVFRHLTQWFEEKRLYHRKDGQVQRKQDDILSATRMAFITRRKARTQPDATPIGNNVPRLPIVGRSRWDK
jgi:phage terminase large subunit-like protein